jgi:hypothetical protein
MLRNSSEMKCAVALAMAASALPSPASAADKVKISALTDLAFGSLSTSTDTTVSENLCANSSTNGYTVTATGNGTASAFTLAGPSFNLPYEVRWAGTPSATSGTALTAGTASPGFTHPSNLQQSCGGGGPASSATLLVTIRAAALGSARAGSYSGLLTISIAPL